MDELRTIEVFKVDAFTDDAYGGNPAGVVPHADGLTEAQMQKVAREMNLSETAFVMAPTEAGRAVGADVRVRFFTPKTEVDLCGHATIGTFFLLASEGRLEGLGRRLAGDRIQTIHQETKAGVLPVHIHWAAGPRVDRVMMVQAPPRILETYLPDQVSRVEAILGLAGALDRSWPAQVLTTGLPFLVVPVVSREKLFGLRPDMSAVAEFCQRAGLIGIHAFARETISSAATAHARMFAPAVGIPEESATGTAGGCLGAYLVLNGYVAPGTPMLLEQGHILGRPSSIHVEVAPAGAYFEVHVGGRAVTTLRGQMLIPSP